MKVMFYGVLQIITNEVKNIERACILRADGLLLNLIQVIAMLKHCNFIEYCPFGDCAAIDYRAILDN